jgi:hypothetical protein
LGGLSNPVPGGSARKSAAIIPFVNESLTSGAPIASTSEFVNNFGSWWNRVGDFWLESAKKAGIAGGFCILKVAIFGMNSGWHEHRNAAGGYGIRIRSQAFARSRRCAEFSVIRRRA